MDKLRFRYLFGKHIYDKLSHDELDELMILMDHLDRSNRDEIIDAILKADYEKEILEQDRKDQLLAKLQQKITANHNDSLGVKLREVRTKTPIRRKIAFIAAAIVFFFAIISLWLRPQLFNPNIPEQKILAGNLTEDIQLPSDSVPFLRLPDGKVKLLTADLDDTNLGEGIRISNDDDGTTIYYLQQKSRDDMSSTPLQKNLVFETPKGYASKVILMDGTKVWLNSGSSLEYPIAFGKDKRKVKLHGEAYFDVFHDTSRPFLVETEASTIRVLGTSFNVSAYMDDKVITTTLVQGSVQLGGKKQRFILRPGEQVAENKGTGKMDKTQVNLDDYTSWKEGYFNFNGKTIHDILDIVKRWYDIEEVVFQTDDHARFTGTFKRTKSLKSLLDKLEKVSDVKFKISERRVVVMD